MVEESTLPHKPPPADFQEAGHRLLNARLALVMGEMVVLLMAGGLLPAALPLTALGGVVALHAGLVALAAWQVRHDTAPGTATTFTHLAADAAVLASLVYFTGGYANPFISLLLLPLILCAVTLGAAQAWAMTAWVAVLYSLLARYYQPLALEVTEQDAIDLHLAGMWLNFLLTAGLVATFVVRLGSALRQRDAHLARAREQALRDEQLFALGMQAAAAAHDLATPLATLRLSLQELEADYAGDEELAPALGVMRGQAERMTVVLERLAAAAGAGRANGQPASQPLDAWLRDTFEHWHLMRPRAAAELSLPEGQAPLVRDEPLLTSVLATLLNNAADAAEHLGGGLVELEAGWDSRAVRLRVLDRGPGLATGMDKPDGWGVGLTLARAALERFNGRLEMHPRPGGGLVVEIRIPLERLLP